MSRRPVLQLSPTVAGKIAAGEVIERPASVVKELIENALDAGASSIYVSVRNGGRDLIEVSDDGQGIPFDELPLAVARHATSKLGSVEDLQTLTTFGFRGEALASIAACSRVEIVSACEDGVAGSLVAENGEAGESTRASRARGTTVSVRGLFRYTPARFKFLKSVGAELARIHGVLAASALANPEVRLALRVDDRDVFDAPGDGDSATVLRALYGAEADNFLPIRVEHRLPRGTSLAGFAASPSLTRANREHMWLFVNRRWVQSRTLTYAVEQAYRTLVMVGRRPVAVVMLDVPPEDVDVNVHPTKSEVKLVREHEIFGALVRCIQDTVMAAPFVPPVTEPMTGAPPPYVNAVATQRPGVSGDEDRGRGGLGSPWPDSPALSPDAVAGSATPAIPFPDAPTLRVLGQVDGTYIVAEGPDGLYMIDQHAAHERIVFDRLAASSGDPDSRPLLEPAVLALEPGMAGFVAEHGPDLERLGFRIEEFGPRSLLIRSVPSVLGRSDPAQALRDIIDELRSVGAGGLTFGEAARWSLACKSAIKAGQPLSGEEQRELVRQLEATRSPQTCAHGRPTMVHLSVAQLERQFGRR